MIKITFIAFMFMFLQGVQVSALTDQEIFLQANQLYDDQQYEKALHLYTAMDGKDCAILYNMGNCYGKLNNHLQAIAYWYQAQKDATDSLFSHIDANIQASHALLGVKGDEGWSLSTSKMIRYVSLLWFQLLFLFLLFALLFFIKNKNRGKKYNVFIATLLFLATAASGILLIIKYQSLKQRKGIVMKSDVSLFAGPDDHYHVLASLPTATCLEIIKEQDSWCKIRYNKTTGWVVKDSLTVV